MEIMQFIGRCLCTAVNSKKYADDEEDDGEEDDDDEDKQGEDDGHGRATRWPEHSSDLRALPKAVQVRP